MNKLINFIKLMKLISKILSFVWIITSCILVSGHISELNSIIDSFVFGTLFLLFPVLLIEVYNNPIFKPFWNNEKDSTLLHFFGRLTRISRVLIFVYVLFIFVTIMEKSDTVIQDVFYLNLGLIVPICIIEYFCNPVCKVIREKKLEKKKLVKAKREEEKNALKRKKEAEEAEKQQKKAQENIQRIEKESERKKQERKDYYFNTYRVKLNNVNSINYMNGHEFEYFCADLLRDNGYKNVSVTRGSGDQGVDVIAIKNGITYAVQCKNYASSLSNKPIQEVNAGKMYYKCDVGVVMTNSHFTSGAIDLARATGTLLWDKMELQKMMRNI